MTPAQRTPRKVASAVLTLLLAAGALAVATSPAHSADSLRIEAENASLAGGARVETEHGNYSGSGYVGGYTDGNKGTASTTFQVPAATAGTYELSLRYANGTGSSKTLTVAIGSTVHGQVTLAPTSGWSSWSTQTIAVPLAVGTHSVVYGFDASDSGNVNLDSLDVTAVASTGSVLQAESAALSGGAQVESNHAGYYGTGFVGGLTDGSKGSARVQFTVNAGPGGSVPLDLRYANGTGSTKTLSLYVDGVKHSTTSFPATGGWASWSSVQSTVSLTAGVRTVEWRFDHSDSGNINLDQLAVGTPSGPTPPGPTEPPEPEPSAGTLQAEDAVLLGGVRVETDHAGYNGTGFVGGFTDNNKGSARVQFAVDAGSGGIVPLDLRYANGTPDAKTLSLYIDGVKHSTTSFPPTGGWATWAVAHTSAELAPGAHTVAWHFDHSDSGNVNLDQLAVGEPTEPTDPPDPDPEPTDQDGEAENAYLANNAGVASSLGGFSGSGYVTGFGNNGAVVTRVLAATQGTTTLTVRYANESGSARSLQVVVNGRVASTLSLPHGSGWHTAATTITTRNGVNTVALRAHGQGSGVLIDRFTASNEVALAARGATTPYVEYQAEHGVTTGSIAPATRTRGVVQSEAVGRQSVRLQGVGQNVRIQLTAPANGIVVRYSIPDNASGTGQSSTLAVYANGQKLGDISLTSEHSWLYGSYPFTNVPSQGGAHRFFDEASIVLPTTLPQGTVLTLQKDASNVSYIDIDLVEAEQVAAPSTAPSNAVSITSHGAVSGQNSTAAINAAVAQARSQGVPVWIPPGTFPVTAQIQLENVTVLGAGPWYSTIKQTNTKGGFWGSGGGVTIADLKISGDATVRNDATDDAAIEGDFSSATLIQNVWTEHTKVGLWVRPGSKDVLAVGLRVRETYADGVNFRDGVANSHVTQSTFRNTGDDALAMWSDGSPVNNSSFTFNTVQVPVLANGLAIYGGTQNRLEDNLVLDTVNAGAGIAVSTRFGVPFAGNSYVQRNTLLRTGSLEPNWQAQLGALWIYADVHEINAPIVVRSMEILDSTYAGILMSWQKSINQVSFDHITISGAGTYGIEVEAGGSTTFSNTVVTGAQQGGLLLQGGHVIHRVGGGNSGF